MRKIYLIGLCTFFFCGQVYAWDSVGHKLSAEMAYQQLTPKAKEQVQVLLNALAAYYPDTREFANAAAWPDWLKGEDVHAFDSWHYINQPVVQDRITAPKPAPQNVVWAIEQSYAVLNSERASRFQKALFLRFLLHFIGDVHQPLHCASLFSKQFPNGDKGGNAYTIHYHKFGNLHALWDRGVGLFRDQRGKVLSAKARQHLAKQLFERYPRSHFTQQLGKHHTPASWAQESLQLAQKYAYQTPLRHKPSEAYLQQGQAIAAQQITLASYRLADTLNKLYG